MNCSEGFRLSSLSGKTCLQFSFLTVSQEYSRSFQSISTQAENHRRSKSGSNENLNSSILESTIQRCFLCCEGQATTIKNDRHLYEEMPVLQP
jgi:hypothetical protein